MKPGGHEMLESEQEGLDDYSDDLLESGALPALAPDAEAPRTETLAAASVGLGQRLDLFLALLYPRTSRSSLQRWIADGCVQVNGRSAKPSYALKESDVVTAVPPAPQPVNAWVGEAMELAIVHEDADVMVINKPAGLVVHPAAGHVSQTLVNGLIAHHPPIITVARAGIVHRLDKDTSGLMVVAKTPAAQLSLVGQLQARTVKREYLALAWGVLESQKLQTMMGRDPHHRQRMAVLSAARGSLSGKEAITEIAQLAVCKLYGCDASLVRCRLHTGRTHQIRVHLEHLKHPIVGDRTYDRHAPAASRLSDGKAAIEALMPGQALHAQRLSFVHPITEKTLSFSVAPPQAFLTLLGWAGINASCWA